MSSILQSTVSPAKSLHYPEDFIDKVICGDCLEVMQNIPDDSIDCIVTDPPYGISFMGKNWDKAIPPIEIWQECNRILKSGAFMFVMCIPRQDCLSRMIISLEDAGFNINFTPIFWAFASGFPKAGNIGKAIDKRLDAEREVIGISHYCPGRKPIADTNQTCYGKDFRTDLERKQITAPATPEAESLDGSYGGFQPKPAVEVIIVAMKPLSEKTYVDQALKNRKGITWLDDGRIPYENDEDFERTQVGFIEETIVDNWDSFSYGGQRGQKNKGRFPANLLVSNDALNDGRIRNSGNITGNEIIDSKNTFNFNWDNRLNKNNVYGDSGSFSRYFSLDQWWAEKLKDLPKEVQKTFPFLITPKASKGEKNEGLDELPDKLMARSGGAQQAERLGKDEYLQEHIGLNRISKVKNYHPTVKPIQLGSYLITLGSREDDVILDPFCGSGSFCISTWFTNRHFIGIEIEKEYYEIAVNRIREYTDQRKLNAFFD